MPSLAFYIFSAIAVAGAICLVCFRNPVTSAMSMVGSFIGLAAIFVGLNAYFVGIIQILVYAGAIMVLFIFIIMLLDLKVEEKRQFRPLMIAAGFVVPILLLSQLIGVLQRGNDVDAQPLDALVLNKASSHYQVDGKDTHISRALGDKEDPNLPDVHLIGHTLFNRYNFPLQVVGVLLLVATIGVVTLSKKGSDRTTKPADQ
jgi:NADH-quinone oxidoreductase subunit J